MAGFGGSIKLTGFSEYRNALKTITQNLSILSSEMKLVNATYDKNDTSINALTSKLNTLNKTYATQEEKVKVLNKQLQEHTEKLEEQKKAHDDLKTKYDTEKNLLESLRLSIGESSSEYQKQASKVSELARAYSQSASNLEYNVQQNGKLKSSLLDAQANATTTGKAVNELKAQIDNVGKGSEEASKEVNNLGTSLKNVGSEAKAGADGFTVFKGVVSSLTADAIRGAINGLKELGSSFIALGKESVGSFAEYEQLTGGIETLFKDSAPLVLEYANNAYKNAGISANEYMETITGFSARLLQTLNGDTKTAVQLSNIAINDMADNANKMGTSMNSIMYAYQGFAKQNYTMLDNLKLGYGGTASEMARLINDSNVLNGALEVTTKNLNEIPFGVIISAIHTIQENLGVTGTTLEEAEKTITGSTNQIKASWKNLLTSIASDTKDWQEQLSVFSSTLSVGLQNFLPRIQNVIKNLGVVIPNLIKEVGDKISPAVDDVISNVITFLSNNIPNIIKELLKVINNLINNLKTEIPTIITNLINSFGENLGGFVDLGADIIGGLIEGLISAIPSLLLEIPNIVKSVITEFAKLPRRLFEIGKRAIKSLWEGVKSIWSYVKNGIEGLFASGSEQLLKLQATSTEEEFLNQINKEFENYKKSQENRLKNGAWGSLGSTATLNVTFSSFLKAIYGISEDEYNDILALYGNFTAEYQDSINDLVDITADGYNRLTEEYDLDKYKTQQKELQADIQDTAEETQTASEIIEEYTNDVAKSLSTVDDNLQESEKVLDDYVSWQNKLIGNFTSIDNLLLSIGKKRTNAENRRAKENEWLYERHYSSKNPVKEEEKGFKEIASDVSSIIKEITQGAGDIVNIIANVVNSLPQIFDSLVSGSNGAGLIEQIFGFSQDLVKNINESFKKLLPYLRDNVKVIINNIMHLISDLLPELLDNLVQASVSIVEGITDALPTILTAIPKTILGILDSFFAEGQIVELGYRIISALVEGIGYITELLPDFIAGIIEKLPEYINQTIKVLLGNLPEFFKLGAQLITSLFEGIVSMIVNLPEVLGVLIQGFVDLLTQIPEQAFEIGKQIIVSMINGIINAFKSLWETISNFFSNFWNWITGKGWNSKTAQKKVEEAIDDMTVSNDLNKKLSDSTQQASASATNNAKMAREALQQIRAQERDIYYNLLNGFKAALGQMEIKLNGETVGQYVEKTINTTVFNGNSITQSVRLW